MVDPGADESLTLGVGGEARATAIASLCRSLHLNAEGLIFGHADDDLRRVRDIGMHSFAALLQELKQPGPLKDQFEAMDVESRD